MIRRKSSFSAGSLTPVSSGSFGFGTIISRCRSLSSYFLKFGSGVSPICVTWALGPRPETSVRWVSRYCRSIPLKFSGRELRSSAKMGCSIVFWTAMMTLCLSTSPALFGKPTVTPSIARRTIASALIAKRYWLTRLCSFEEKFVDSTRGACSTCICFASRRKILFRKSVADFILFEMFRIARSPSV
jgi:hypothetical protein